MAKQLSEVLKNWRSQLLDTSKRNRLVNCKFARGGAVAFEHPSLATVWEALVVAKSSLIYQQTDALLAGEADEPTLLDLAATDADGDSDESAEAGEVDSSAPKKSAAERNSLSTKQVATCRQSDDLYVNAILTKLTEKALDGRLKRLSVAAGTSLSEQGVNSLFVACGFLKWFESADSEEAILSPLALVPVSLSRETAESEWELSALDDELVPNHPLAEILKNEFKITLPAFADDELDESSASLDLFFDRVRAAVPKRWTVEPTVALGTFAFQKIAMWHDLRDHENAIVDNAICRGMAGDDSAMPTSEGMTSVTESDLDVAVPLESHHLIVDCDSSQLAAIQAVKQGRNLILDGPPGTGKSQTIANIIAECLAAGKTVLFVSEKAAALEVVKRRLDKANVGDFCLELHSHKANKKHIIDELGRSLTRPNERYPSVDQKLAELRRSRDKLNEYVRALHVEQSNLKQTPYKMHGRLAQIHTTASTRVMIEKPFALDENSLGELLEAVGRLANCRAIVAAHGMHPWRGMKAELYSLSLVEDIRFHFTRAADGLQARLNASADLIPLGFMSAQPTLTQLDEAIASTEAVLKYPPVPQHWIDNGLAETAQRFLALHRDAESYRILLSGLSSYRGEAVDLAESEAFAKAAQTTATNELMRAPAYGVRERIARFGEVSAALSSLASAFAALNDAVKKLQTTVGMPQQTVFTIVEAETLARHSAVLASVTGLNASWFESATRERLRKTIAAAEPIALMASASRKSLAAKLQPGAFMDIASSQIADLLKNASWFKRWGSSWRRAKQAFVLLYQVSPPDRARTLIDDAYQLGRYHDYQRQLRAAVGADAEAIGWNGDVDFPWTTINERMHVISTLPADMRSAESVSNRLSAAGQQDGAHLSMIADDVGRACKSAIDAADRVSQLIQVEPAFGTHDLSRYPFATAIARAGTVAAQLESGVRDLSALSVLLEADQDVPVKTLAEDYAVLVEARAIRLSANQVAQSLGEPLKAAGTRVLCDVSSQALLADWVQSFLRQHDGHPSAHLLRALSSTDIRQRLAKCAADANGARTPAAADSLKFVRSLFDREELARSGIDLDAQPIQAGIRWIQERIRDADRVSEWKTFVDAVVNMKKLGLTTLSEEILSHAVPVEQAVDVLRARVFKLWLDHAYKSEPTLRDFDLLAHSQDVERFRELDRFWIANGYSRVRQRVLAKAPRVGGLEADAPGNSEVGILLREVNKKRRHLPIRKLFAAIPSLLLKMKPCVMMSPLAVSTYFENDALRFDVVVFDEASQVRPHDAVCAIYRGNQLVVAGDQKQLPPSNFFERLAVDGPESDDDEEQSDTRDYESILDVCSSLRFPRQRLKWHYRSRREALIAFSNRHFYDDELVTFPSAKDVEGEHGVKLESVPEGRWAGGTGGGVNAMEAVKMALEVIEHAKLHPDLSLGVITMNQAQQMRVYDEINARRRGNPDLEPFFSTERPEPFFVKNLENVQGDERDVIFLGVGYAKNAAGTLSHNFGPLNKLGGERRLNVAVTRARTRLSLFSSIVADDIDLSRTAARGAKLLRAYLEFAARGPSSLGSEITADGEEDFDSDFEREVARALSEAGLNVRRQVGCSKFRIDLALVDPRQPGRYVLGVECDGRTYHSSATARDRDRLRQEQLEDKGWRICRIWSTDWIRDPRRQIEKVLAAYEKALASGDTSPQAPIRDERLQVELVPELPQEDQVTPLFSDINEVSTGQLRRTLVDCIEMYGTMPADDLAQHASRKLGFARMGSRIRDRIMTEIEHLLARKLFSRTADDRIGPVTASHM